VVATEYGPPQTRGVSLLSRLRYRYIPDHLLGELLAQPGIDSSVPALLLVLILATYSVLTPDFFTIYSLQSFGRLLGEFAFVAIGEAIVVIGGGIDLSVGSIFALCNLIALALTFVFKVNVLLVLPLTLAVGAAIGALNGVLVGYLKLRAFLTTLVTLILVRSIASWLGVIYGYGLVSDFDNINGQAVFDFVGSGAVLGVPSSLVVALAVALAAHIMLSRTRLGWHILAVGGSRRSAFNASVNVRRTVFLTYLISGAMAGLAAFFYAMRLNSVAESTGLGLELNIILGTVLGGISLGGGRGSITKALLGATVVLCINNGMLRLDLAAGGSSIILGLILLLAVLFDIKWNKNRLKILGRAYVSPTLVELPPRPSILADANASQSGEIGKARSVGKGLLVGPGAVVIDSQGDLITGNAKGEIIRLRGPDLEQLETLAYIGGRPLGMQVDRDGSLVVCVAGIGLYRISEDGRASVLTVQTKRGFSISDDSRIRMANGLDIAPDGKIYFSDSTVRYDASDWMTDALEGRANGRLLRYDPSSGTTSTVVPNLVFAAGVCLAADGLSMLIAETWASRIVRYWIAGPKSGKIEGFVPSLPGYPGHIARSSDGHFWVTLVGVRTPVFDLAQETPDFRRRMIGRLGADDWLSPNTNTGCVIKFNDLGRVVETLWDGPSGLHPEITSVREHKGKLYLSGVNNDKVGVLDLPGADQSWTDSRS
jgi:ribose transport system permease protein